MVVGCFDDRLLSADWLTTSRYTGDIGPTLALSSLVTPGVTQSQRRCRSYAAGITTPGDASVTESVASTQSRQTINSVGQRPSLTDFWRLWIYHIGYSSRVSYSITCNTYSGISPVPLSRSNLFLHLYLSEKNPLVMRQLNDFHQHLIQFVSCWILRVPAKQAPHAAIYQQTILSLILV